MKNIMLRILCVAVMLLMLLTACNLTETEIPAATTEPVVEVPDDPDTVEIISVEANSTPIAVPTEAPTAVPTEATPEETEEPIRQPEPATLQNDGEITANFPDYDTGADADYSYQSDNLRIAIKVHKEMLTDNKKRKLNEVYYVADIWIRNLNSFRTAFANGKVGGGSEEGDVLARRENAIFAVNGSYNQGLILQQGQVCKKQREDKGWNSGAVGLIYQDGTLKTFYLQRESFNVDREIQNGAWYGWQFGPIIIRDYEAGPGSTSYHNMGFKARNMLGYYEPGHYVIVTCDCRGDDAQGMNEYMMVDLMKSLGVKEAFNLDGGTSAVMVFMGKIINHPTLRNDNGTMVEGRPIVDMLLFGEYDENGVSADLSTFTAAKFPGK